MASATCSFRDRVGRYKYALPTMVGVTRRFLRKRPRIASTVEQLTAEQQQDEQRQKRAAAKLHDEPRELDVDNRRDAVHVHARCRRVRVVNAVSLQVIKPARAVGTIVAPVRSTI